jgi:hypothetical protein
MLGLWIGVALETRYVRFSVTGPARQRALRYAIGVAVLAVIWFGLGAIIPAGPSLFGVARYTLVMGWAAAGWPWLFVRLGLGIEEGS